MSIRKKFLIVVLVFSIVPHLPARRRRGRRLSERSSFIRADPRFPHPSAMLGSGQRAYPPGDQKRSKAPFSGIAEAFRWAGGNSFIFRAAGFP
jgi:hypothetical protein